MVDNERDKSFEQDMIKSLIHTLKTKPSGAAMQALLTHIVKMEVYVPFRMYMKEKKENMTKEEFIKNTILIPEWFTNPSKQLLLPIFTHIDHIKREEFSAENTTFMLVGIDYVIKYIDSNKDAVGFVINPFTDLFPIQEIMYEKTKELVGIK